MRDQNLNTMVRVLILMVVAALVGAMAFAASVFNTH